MKTFLRKAAKFESQKVEAISHFFYYDIVSVL